MITIIEYFYKGEAVAVVEVPEYLLMWEAQEKVKDFSVFVPENWDRFCLRYIENGTK